MRDRIKEVHYDDVLPGGHACHGETPTLRYGSAIESCAEHKDGTLWAGHSEYLSQVSFCPYCGFKAKAPAVVVAEEEE